MALWYGPGAKKIINKLLDWAIPPGNQNILGRGKDFACYKHDYDETSID